MMSSTTINVSMHTKNLLLHFGKDRESYDHIIRRLVEEAGWKELDAKWNTILDDDEFISLDEL